MKRLFNIDENNKCVIPNTEWLYTIPSFKKLQLKRGKEFIKYVTYIYYYCDFTSPIYDSDDNDRHKESLKYSQLDQIDIDEIFINCINDFNSMQELAARPLKTYKSIKKGLAELDKYYENINFAAVDKQGKLLFSPKEFQQNIETVKSMYKSLDEFKNSVEQELKKAASIRGKSEMGERERTGKKRSGHDENSLGQQFTKLPPKIEI